MHEYHKIDCLYYRDPDTRMLDSSRYRNPCVEYLKDLLWVFTEKVDGTNIRVVWDGYRVSFYGRTDRAVIPDGLMKRLEELFGGEENEQLFEQRFGNKEVIIFGEGYGGKIQANVGYRPNEDFIIFDVEINGNMLMREDVKDIASMFKCSIVPIAIIGTIADAVKYVSGFPKSMLNESVQMEGVVGIPAIGLKDKSGNRIITKIKVRELQEVEKQEKMAAKNRLPQNTRLQSGLGYSNRRCEKMAIKTFTTCVCDICGEKQAIRRRMLAYRTFDANDGRQQYDKPVLEQVEIDLCDKCSVAATNLHDIGVCREEYEIRRIGQ